MSQIDLEALRAAFAEHRSGRFRLDRKIGKGGMGTVYLGFDTVREKPIALKVINLEMLEKESVLARFRREAKTMFQVEHQNVVRVYDLDDLQGGLPFLVLEWVEGASLSSYVDQHGPLPVRAAVQLMIWACEGVEAAHAKGVIHRDIKPDNILVTSEWVPKVIDFGIAMIETGSTRLTQDGTGMGSLGFMAPEQMQEAKTVDPRADVHALGVTLWSTIKGELPPPGLFFGLTFDSQPELFEEIPEELNSLIQSATKIRVEERCASVRHFREALLEIQENLKQNATAPTTALYAASEVSVAVVSPFAGLLRPGVSDSFLAAPTFPHSVVRSPPHHLNAQEIAARLASPPPLRPSTPAVPPPSVDTLHEGSGAVGMSATQFGRELAAARREGHWRSVLIAASLVVGGLFAWVLRTTWTTSLPSDPTHVATAPTPPPAVPLTPAPQEPTSAATTAATTVGVSLSLPSQPSQPLASTSTLQRREGEVETNLPPAPAAESAPPPSLPKVEPPPAEALPKPAKKQKTPKEKDKHPAEPKPGKPKHPPSEGKVVAKAPEVPEAVPEKVRVGLTLPEGVVPVWLIGPSGRVNLPGSVSPGTYKVMVRWPNDGQDRTAIGTLSVGAAGVTISCNAQTLKCRPH